jgi:hypothetical protein
MHTLDRVVSHLSLLSRVAIEDTVQLDAQKSSALSGCKLQLSVILLLCTGILSFPALAQVKIHEKIEIRPTPKPNAHAELPERSVASIPPGWYIAPSTGTYFGQIGELSAKNEAPTGSITVTTRDTILVFNVEDYIARRGSDVEIATDRCNEWATVLYTAYYAVAYGTQLGFLIPGVHQGDTLKFSYDGCTSLPKQTRRHTVEMALRDPYADACYIYYEGELQESVYCGLDISLSYQEAELDHFAVRFDKDTVAFTKSARIFVQAKDRDDNDIELEADRLVKFSLTANDEYGTFIDKNGDTLKTTPVQLEHILYGDAKAGLIQFAAVRKNPVDPVLSKVRVESESDPTKAGEGELPVVEQTLKIVMEGKREVVPRNLGGLRMPPPPTAQNRTEFRVQLTRNNVPVPNHPFQLTNDYIDGTGGHDHVAPRRDRNRDNYGYFILKRTNDITDSPYNGQTQADGRETFDFVSSFFGDRMCLRVESAQPNKKQFLWDTLSIAEKVPGLVNFGSIQNNMWRLTGSNGITSYWRCVETQIQHSDNHYASDLLFENLQLAIVDFFRWSGSSQENGGFGIYLVLGVNDMSLVNGGLFDICGTWQQGHTYHRIGSSVDIDVNATHFGDRGTTNLNTALPDGTTILNVLTDKMLRHGGNKYNEEPIHYGFGGQ